MVIGLRLSDRMRNERVGNGGGTNVVCWTGCIAVAEVLSPCE